MRIRLILVVLAALAGATLTFFVARGHGDKGGTPTPRGSIQGPQATIGDLTYNVTDVRILKRNRPVDAPYLVNKEPSPKGFAYLGVFLKIYNNNPKKAGTVAPGYLLEPSGNPGLVAMQQSSESPYALTDLTVPAGSEVPVPGSPAAGGPIQGALLLYWINGAMTAQQPFRLVVHTGNENAFITLPPVPNLKGGGH